jgi:2-polyprenyl-3-methyl-5-hydroxy-6-metoxy-1,4-benzoquinol methylase
MHWTFPLTRLDADEALLAILGAAAERLETQLRLLSVDRLDISDYNRHYLQQKIAGLHNNMRKTATLLAWALAPCQRPLAELTLVDYGAGTGILALLAKEAGVGTVLHNDIYPVSCHDAERIAQALGVALDGYVPGDLDALGRYLLTNDLTCQVMVSNDVIEHIYDIETHLRALEYALPGLVSVCLATDANPRNPIRRRTIARMQRAAETTDRPAVYGHKERDTLRAFASVRRELILAAMPELPTATLSELVARTRGLNQADIAAAMARYRHAGELPSLPRHPTNTCDPLTGNWQERLVDPFLLRDQLAAAGFAAAVRNGYYGQPRHPAKRLVVYLLNRTIRLTGSAGIRLAPFFALCGTRSV